MKLLLYTIIIAYFIRVCQFFDLLQFERRGAWENVLPSQQPLCGKKKWPLVWQNFWPLNGGIVFVFFLCQSEFILLPSGDMYHIKGF